MDIGRQLEKIRDNSNKALFQNLKYQTERISKKNIIIDLQNVVKNEQQKALQSTLIIDKTSEVYLESIYFIFKNTITKSTPVTPPPSRFLPLFREPIIVNFKMLGDCSSSNNDEIDGNFIIILEEPIIYSDNPINNSDDTKMDYVKVVSVKNKKLNYISTINPMKINDIELSIKSEELKKINEQKNEDEEMRIIIELIIISKE